MATEGKTIIFYCCNLFIVSIDERPAMRSQPNLASRSEVESIYKCPTKISGFPPKTFGRKKSTFGPLFCDFRTRHSISQERNVAWTNKNAIVNLQCVPRWPTFHDLLTPKRLRSVCLLWRNIRRPLHCNHQNATYL